MCGDTLNTIDTKSVVLNSDENFRKHQIQARKQFKITHKIYATGSIFFIVRDHREDTCYMRKN
jgi:hypothetical protein